MPIVSERDLDGRINCLIGNLIDETRGLRPEVSRVAMFTLIHEWISAQWFAIKSRDDHPKILTLLALVELEAALQFLVLRHDFHELQCHIDRIDETLNEVTRPWSLMKIVWAFARQAQNRKSGPACGVRFRNGL